MEGTGARSAEARRATWGGESSWAVAGVVLDVKWHLLHRLNWWAEKWLVTVVLLCPSEEPHLSHCSAVPGPRQALEGPDLIWPGHSSCVAGWCVGFSIGLLECLICKSNSRSPEKRTLLLPQPLRTSPCCGLDSSCWEGGRSGSSRSLVVKDGRVF